MTVDELRAIRDPLERAKAAGAFLERARPAVADAKQVRDLAVVDLLVAGHTQRQVAAELDVSPATVAGIASAHGVQVTRVATA